METTICENEDELSSAILECIENGITLRSNANDPFSLGLSGGSMVGILSKILLKLSDSNYSNIHFFFCDERHIADIESKDFTYNLYNEALFSKRSTCIQNIHSIDLSLNLEQSHKKYDEDIRTYFQSQQPKNGESMQVFMPSFDMLFLGIGPDGHTASLFPNHELLNKSSDIWTASISNSPKPPPCRVTMTLGLINAANMICFVATGDSKADMVKRCVDAYKVGGKPIYPASLVAPVNGKIIWFLDQKAAMKLNS